MRPAEELNRSIFLTFFLVLNLESALNDALLLLQAPKLVDLLRMCELIELHTAVPPYVRRQTLRFAWALVAFQVTETILYVALTAYSGFGTSLLVEEGRQIAPFRMGLAVSNGFVGVPYLALMNTSTRLLVTYFSQTIALYLGCIYRNTDRKVLLVDQVRVQLSLIKNCVDMVSTLVGPSLLYAYAYSVAILCVSAYYTIIPELKLPVRIFFFFFALLHFLSIVLPPIMAQRMNTAVCELRTVVQGVLMEDCSDELMVQDDAFVRKLYGTLDTRTLGALVKYYKAGKIPGNPDAVYLLTRRDLATMVGGVLEKNIIGVAYLKTVCTKEAAGIGEDDASSYSGVVTMAHELAHM
ncbi:hypothetical protein V5799_016990 [Amblyomma americanum]|uniref:Uncharacterized protein n=1 Tax=Amblyomma americanum TaxID=6943 RepID=A0AAQ4F3L8_AMBAM